jgi:hypothetical protein
MQWHPLVAPLVGHVGLDGKRATLPAGALAQLQVDAKGLDGAGRAELAVHVVAFARMLWTSRSTLDVDAVIEELATVAATLMGDADKARDAFAAQGMPAGVLGLNRPMTAPKEAPRAAPGAPVKASRGLKKS